MATLDPHRAFARLKGGERCPASLDIDSRGRFQTSPSRIALTRRRGSPPIAVA